MSGPSAAAVGPPEPRVIEVSTRTIDVKGKAATVYELIAPGARRKVEFVAGESFHVRISNKLAEPTIVHWHGLTPPTHQDGVPGLSQDPIGPGLSYDYDFRLTEPGTHWMHTHFSLTQMQRMMAAPLIIHDPAERHLDEQQVVVMLHDFTFRDPEEILAELGQRSAHQTAGEGGHPKADANAHSGEMADMPSSRAAPTGDGAMDDAMDAMVMDLNDVDFDAYLANDRTLDDPEVVPVEAGGRVRLRIINAGTSTNFFIDLGELEGELIAVDGHAVIPVRGRRFPLAMAQRLDVRLQLPAAGGVYPVLAEREGDTVRTGIILATKGATIPRVSDQAPTTAGVVGLKFEQRLQPRQPLQIRPVDRTHRVVLGGDMEKYVWTMNGAVHGAHEPLAAELGERIEIVMRNDTGMSHPMHLHGTVHQVVEIAGKRLEGARRDTVMVPARASVTIAFDADNAGRWAFHCHNSYHQEAGMMTTLEYV